MLGRRGHIWSEWVVGLAVIFVVGLIYIILQQTYTHNIYPAAIARGTDATNLNYLDLAWKLWPVPVMLAVLYGMINAGLARGYRDYDV